VCWPLLARGVVAAAFEHGDQVAPTATRDGGRRRRVLATVAEAKFLASVRQRAAHLESVLDVLIDRHRLAGRRGRGLLQALDLGGLTGPRVVESARALAPTALLLNSPRPSLLRFMPALNGGLDEIDRWPGCSTGCWADEMNPVTILRSAQVDATASLGWPTRRTGRQTTRDVFSGRSRSLVAWRLRASRSPSRVVTDRASCMAVRCFATHARGRESAGG
jgi:hypothetical protein